MGRLLGNGTREMALVSSDCCQSLRRGSVPFDVVCVLRVVALRHRLKVVDDADGGSEVGDLA